MRQDRIYTRIDEYTLGRFLYSFSSFFEGLSFTNQWYYCAVFSFSYTFTYQVLIHYCIQCYTDEANRTSALQQSGLPPFSATNLALTSATLLPGIPIYTGIQWISIVVGIGLYVGISDRQARMWLYIRWSMYQPDNCLGLVMAQIVA